MVQFGLNTSAYFSISENKNNNATIKEDALFDELISREFNEKKLVFSDGELDNIHVPSTDKVHSLTNIDETAAVLNMSFLQNTISLTTPNPFTCSQIVNLEAHR